MRPINKEKIIKEGTMREKIKLYFTHIALGNVWLEKKPLLTEPEIMAIYTKIKEPKDIKYYDTLRRFSNLFIQMLKPAIIRNRYDLEKQLYYLSNTIAQVEIKNQTNLLRLQEQKMTLMEQSERLIKSLQNYQDLNAELNLRNFTEQIIYYNETGKKIGDEIYKLQKEIAEGNKTEKVELNKKIVVFVKEVNQLIDTTKTYLEEYKLYVKKLLPLQVYKEFIQKEEIIAIHTIENIKEIIEKYLNEKDIYPPTKPEDKNGKFYIYSWDDVEVDIEEKELEFYKRLAYE